MRLQFSEDRRDDALAVLDKLRASEPISERMRFLFHRIDSRGWKPVEDSVNNRIIFEPEDLEPDLKEIHQQTQDEMQIRNRFSALYIWARETFERRSPKNKHYETSNEALLKQKSFSKNSRRLQ